jgi:hypothetical protein
MVVVAGKRIPAMIPSEALGCGSLLQRWALAPTVFFAATYGSCDAVT